MYWRLVLVPRTLATIVWSCCAVLLQHWLAITWSFICRLCCCFFNHAINSNRWQRLSRDLSRLEFLLVQNIHVGAYTCVHIHMLMTIHCVIYCLEYVDIYCCDAAADSDTVLFMYTVNKDLYIICICVCVRVFVAFCLAFSYSYVNKAYFVTSFVIVCFLYKDNWKMCLFKWSSSLLDPLMMHSVACCCAVNYLISIPAQVVFVAVARDWNRIFQSIQSNCCTLVVTW